MNTRGFTLIEMLVSMVILTIVVGLVYAGFSSVADTMAAARENTLQQRTRQFITRSFHENIAAIYSDSGCEQDAYKLTGETKDGTFGPEDSLHFCTSLPMPGAKALPGVLKVVNYALVEPQDADNKHAFSGLSIDRNDDEQQPDAMLLEITETPLVTNNADSSGSSSSSSGTSSMFGGQSSDSSKSSKLSEALNSGAEEGLDSHVTRVPVRSFDVMYYDNETKDWVEDWDSLNKTRMPWAVHIRINLPKLAEETQDDDDEADIDMTISLPTGAGVSDQFIDHNHKVYSGITTNTDSNLSGSSSGLSSSSSSSSSSGFSMK